MGGVFPEICNNLVALWKVETEAGLGRQITPASASQTVIFASFSADWP
jgi:hypothetical protein